MTSKVSERQIQIYNQLISSYTGPCIGVRHIFAILGFMGFLNVYAMRVNLSVAIVAMVNDTSEAGKNISENSCPAPIVPSNSSIPDHDQSGEKFDWDSKTQGLVLGSFFYGYVATQLPGGRLAEIFGGKWIFGIGILMTSVFPVIMPWAAKQSFGLLIAVRVIEGK